MTHAHAIYLHQVKGVLAAGLSFYGVVVGGHPDYQDVAYLVLAGASDYPGLAADALLLSATALMLEYAKHCDDRERR